MSKEQETRRFARRLQQVAYDHFHRAQWVFSEPDSTLWRHSRQYFLRLQDESAECYAKARELAGVEE